MKNRCFETDGWKAGQERSKRTQRANHIKRVAAYNLSPKICRGCDEQIVYDKRRNDFCSKSCSASYHNRAEPKRKKVIHIPNKCLWCGAKAVKLGYKYCNNICSAEHRHQMSINLFLSGQLTVRGTIRKVLISLSGRFCDVCKFYEWMGEPIALEVDHKDGDASNNHPTNIQKICPNCHANTKTWKGRNRGFGRKSRDLPIH